jgi:prepilin-type N-terminal cleavage/methylation domain-containing protein
MSVLARARQRASRSGGFTMVELLMTMLILTIVLMGLAALQVGTIRQVTASRRANEATRLAGSVIESYRHTRFADLPANTAWLIQNNANVTQMVLVGVDGQSDGPFTVEYMAETVNSTRIITVRVKWKDVRPSAEKVDMTKKYQEFFVTMSCRRFI